MGNLCAATHRSLVCSHCSHAESNHWLKWMRSHKPLIPIASPSKTLSGSLVHLPQHPLAPMPSSKSEVLNVFRLIITYSSPKTRKISNADLHNLIGFFCLFVVDQVRARRYRDSSAYGFD